MILKKALIGAGAAAGIGALFVGLRKTHGLPRYLIGLAGLDALRRAVRNGRRPSGRDKPLDVVEFNSEQSFPASDPPSWTAGSI